MWQLETVTLKDLQHYRPNLAVVPLGAIEPHNYHLPYGNDFLTVTRVAQEACRQAFEAGARIVLLPGIPYGVDKNLLSFPLTIHVSLFTLYALLSDIIRSLEKHGVDRLVLINGHGGNTLKPLLREWYGDTQLFVSVIDWWKVGLDVYDQIFEKPDDHAGEMETSVALAMYPELVRLDQAVWQPPRRPPLEAIREGWAQITRPWHRLAPTSGTADPRAATAEKGQRYLRLVIDRIARYLVELSRAEIRDGFPELNDNQ